MVKSIIKKQLREKKYSIPKPLEVGLVMGMLNWQSSERWKEMAEIIDTQELISNQNGKFNPNFNPFWKSQKTNFPKYIKRLESRHILESCSIIKKHKYRKDSKAKAWRIKRNLSTYALIKSWCSLYDELSAEMHNESKYLSFFENSNYVKVINPHIKDAFEYESNKIESQDLLNNYYKAIEKVLFFENLETIKKIAEKHKLKVFEFRNILIDRLQNHNQSKEPKTDKTISKQKNSI